MINLNHLRIFYESAKEMNFSRAAERLRISQSAVSIQIKQMEEALQIKLFYKIGNKVFLSEAGKLLLQYAQKIFELESSAEKAINDMKAIKKGILHIGTTKTYARYLMPNYISRFHALYPEVSIHLSEGSSHEMIQSLLNMQNELAIVARSKEYPKSLQSIPFRKEEILLVVSSRHALAKKDSIAMLEVTRVPLVMNEEGSATRKTVMDVFKNRGLAPSILYEASNPELVKELIERGEGASFIVRSSVSKELSEGILKEIKITDVSITMHTDIVYLDAKALSKIAHAFIETLLILPDE
jgi:DNA-binding transcriptional LysR family regulator